jgi:signal transduction histidine kinase
MNRPSVSTPTAVKAQPPGEMETRLRGGFLLLTRVVWVGIALLSLGLYVASIPTSLASLYVLCTDAPAVCNTTGHLTPDYLRALQGLGLSLDVFAAYQIALLIVFVVVYTAIGALLFWRKSDDRMALFASLTLVTFPAAFSYMALATLPSAWWWPSQFVILLGNSSLFLFFYLFPTGRFVPRWTCWLWLGAIVFWAVNGFFPSLPFRHSLLRDVLFLGFVGSLLVAQCYRYLRVSSAAQRQQTKWVVFGLSLGLGGFLALGLGSTFFPSLFPPGPLTDLITNTAQFLCLLFVPLSIGVAILRSRLFDIDSIINRTLVYGILTVGVVGLYVLVVGYLGVLFRSSDNLLISLVAAGLIVVLFHPLRTLLQRGVNHLLYGQRDEPYTVITRLSQRLEVTLAPDAVLSTIVVTVAQALKLPYVAILLLQEEPPSPVGDDASASHTRHSPGRKEDIFALAASYGRPVGEPLILPLTYQAETVGQLHLAPRTPGEALTRADRRLLDELGRQAGLAAHAIQLTSDLQRSREQLEQRVEERTRELSSLLEVSHTVASTLQLKPLLGLILDQLKAVVGYTGASIFAVEGEELILLDDRNPDPREHLMPLRFPRKRLGLMWQTLTSRESPIIRDVHDDSSLAQAFRLAVGDLSKTASHAVRACMIVPLMLRDQVIGMLVLVASEEDAFTQHQATLALAIATQAAIAIENAQLYEQAQQLAAVEERQRLARELHDSVSQALYGIALGLHTARIQLDRDPGELPESLNYLLSLAEAALEEMRALIFELRPESLESEGLVVALSKQGAALQARHGMAVQTELCEEPNLPLQVKQALYRIAQEAMHNTVKHARASKVELVLRQTATAVVLEVRDDGVGFDPTGSFPGHLGLHSMQERLSSLSGMLQIESAPGQGTSIVVQVPEVT